MDFGDFGQVVLYSFCSLAALFILTKLMGNRQMSQLTMFDYIVGISIGSLAAEMASHPDPESWLGLAAMVIYAMSALLLNILTSHSLKARRLFIGKALVLYDHGLLYYQNLRKCKLDLGELMTECRNAGYFDLAQLQIIMMEENGKLSFLPNEQDRPLTPADMQLFPQQSRPIVSVIMDGIVFPKRLHAVGLTPEWLQKQMELQGYKRPEQILLATVDSDNALAIYEKEPTRKSKDYYA